MVDRLMIVDYIDGPEMEKHPEGKFVSYDDYKSLESKLAEKTKECEDLNDSLMAELRDPNGTIWEVARDYQKKNDLLEAEANAMRETIKRLEGSK